MHLNQDIQETLILTGIFDQTSRRANIKMIINKNYLYIEDISLQRNYRFDHDDPTLELDWTQFFQLVYCQNNVKEPFLHLQNESHSIRIYGTFYQLEYLFINCSGNFLFSKKMQIYNDTKLICSNQDYKMYQYKDPFTSKIMQEKIISPPTFAQQYKSKTQIEYCILPPEIEILKRLHKIGCPNVVKMVQYYRQENQYSFTFNIENLINLKTFLKNYEPLSYSTIVNIFEQALTTLLIFEKEGIIHNDLNLENIFIDPDFHQVCIGGFTFSVLDKWKENIRRGTPGYISPEYFKEKLKITTAVNIFQLGVVIYHLQYLFSFFFFYKRLCNRNPFGITQHEIFLNNTKGLLDFSPLNKHYSPLVDIVTQMLNSKPSKRGNCFNYKQNKIFTLKSKTLLSQLSLQVNQKEQRIKRPNSSKKQPTIEKFVQLIDDFVDDIDMEIQAQKMEHINPILKKFNAQKNKE